jgi:hypothetical protein
VVAQFCIISEYIFNDSDGFMEDNTPRKRKVAGVDENPLPPVELPLKVQRSVSAALPATPSLTRQGSSEASVSASMTIKPGQVCFMYLFFS